MGRSTITQCPVSFRTTSVTFVATSFLGRTDIFEWKGPDGFAEDGILFYPPGFSRDKKYPLVLYIHGGPQFSSTTNFDFNAQLFASRGYVLFRPNYRGSDSLDNKYMRAIVNDAGEGPGCDIMAGLAALEKEGSSTNRASPSPAGPMAA